MKTREVMGKRVARGYARASGLALIAVACGGTAAKSPSVGSESHFLAHCAASCDGGLDCIGGICTRACLTERASCSDLAAAAACTNQSVEPGEVAVCDVRCTGNADCGTLGSDYACDAGFCRQLRSPSAEGPVASPGNLSPAAGALDCEAFGDQTPPPDQRAISIVNTGSVPLYILPVMGCPAEHSLVRVERDGQLLRRVGEGAESNLLGGVCGYVCQQVMEEDWPSAAPRPPRPNCPSVDCTTPDPVLIEPGQTLLHPADLEWALQLLPRSCGAGISAETLECYSRAIPQPGNYTLTVYAAATLNCTPGVDCTCALDTNGVCSNFTPELLVFSSPSTWYFQNQELRIAAPVN